MEELRLTCKELKNIFNESKVIGNGYFGIVLDYHDKLYKIDNCLYKKATYSDMYLFKNNVEKYYEYGDNFNDPKQIELLTNIQNNVKLTKLPKGIITIKDINNEKVCGIILPYHKGYENLDKFPLSHKKDLLIILKKLLLAAKELENNQISQEDFAGYATDGDIYKRNYNVLYKGLDVQIIDMSGKLVKVQDEYLSSCNMYRSLSNILIDYYYFYKIKCPYIREKVTTYEENEEMLNKLIYELKL